MEFIRKLGIRLDESNSILSFAALVMPHAMKVYFCFDKYAARLYTESGEVQCANVNGQNRTAPHTMDYDVMKLF